MFKENDESNEKHEKVTTGYNQTDKEGIAGGSFVIGACKMSDRNFDYVFKGKIGLNRIK